MTGWQALAVFAGGPALIVLLIFLPFYGRRWARRLAGLVRRRPPSATTGPAGDAPAVPASPPAGTDEG